MGSLTVTPRRKEIYKKYAKNIPKNIFQNTFDGEKYMLKYDEKYFKNVFLLPSFGTINDTKNKFLQVFFIIFLIYFHHIFFIF